VTLIKYKNIPAELTCKSEVRYDDIRLCQVSPRDQDFSSQVAELKAAGSAKVFQEKVSGAKTNRAELTKAIGRLEQGDVLVVTRFDRLARSTRTSSTCLMPLRSAAWFQIL